jgi:hypothetical protein
VICAGEVWIQFFDFYTFTSTSTWLESLTPELESYFRHQAREADFEHCRCEQERSALRIVIDWYARRPA